VLARSIRPPSRQIFRWPRIFFRPSANIARSARRPLSFPPKLLAICEKLHNLGIYRYGLANGSSCCVSRGTTSRSASLGPPVIPLPVPISPADPRRFHDWTVAWQPFLPARLPDLMPAALGRFLLWSTLLAISAVCKKFDWRRYRCS
jgi:hypothetical protein